MLGDFHCGLRGFQQRRLPRPGPPDRPAWSSPARWWSRPPCYGMKITEVPTTLSPDRRTRPPHLRPWRDGWRHLRFLLMFSPRWLFSLSRNRADGDRPGRDGGAAAGTAALFGARFDVHTLVYASALTVIGYQAILFSVFARVYAMTTGFLPGRSWIEELVDAGCLEARAAGRPRPGRRRAGPLARRPVDLGRHRLRLARLPRHPADRHPGEHDADPGRADRSSPASSSRSSG